MHRIHSCAQCISVCVDQQMFTMLSAEGAGIRTRQSLAFNVPAMKNYLFFQLLVWLAPSHFSGLIPENYISLFIFSQGGCGWRE